MDAADAMVAAAIEVIEKANPIYQQHQSEPCEMVVPVESVERLRQVLLDSFPITCRARGIDHGR